MIECQICGRKLGNLTGKHLTSHNMSAAEYKLQYPGHPVTMPRTQSEETKEKRAASMRGRSHSEETKAKIGAGNKGKTRSQQDIDKWRESYSEFLMENGGSPQKGYKRSQEFKDRMSEIASNRDPKLVQAKVDQMLSVRRGQQMTDAQKVKYSEARLKYIEENPDKVIPKLFNTKPEQEFEQELIKRGITYKKNARLGNRLFDFLVADCAVELDGPYHRNALMHGHKGMSQDERQKILEATQDRDVLKTKLAQNAGYRVFRMDVTNHLPVNWHQLLVDQGWDIF
jgi:hypothetical protein